MTIENKYLLFLISKLITKFQRAYNFTKLDVHWSFNNIQIQPDNK